MPPLITHSLPVVNVAGETAVSRAAQSVLLKDIEQPRLRTTTVAVDPQRTATLTLED